MREKSIEKTKIDLCWLLESLIKNGKAKKLSVGKKKEKMEQNKK